MKKQLVYRRIGSHGARSDEVEIDGRLFKIEPYQTLEVIVTMPEEEMTDLEWLARNWNPINPAADSVAWVGKYSDGWKVIATYGKEDTTLNTPIYSWHTVQAERQRLGLDAPKGGEAMDRPTEQQLRDPAWWDENAPADAKWVIIAKPDNRVGRYVFAKTFDDPENAKIRGSYQGHLVNGTPYSCDCRHWERPIPRPADAPEWDGKGLPPVGATEKDFTIRGIDGSERYEVLAHREGMAVVYFYDPSGVATVTKYDISPIKSQEQREREELRRDVGYLASKYHYADGDPDMGAICDALYEMGYRKQD